MSSDDERTAARDVYEAAEALNKAIRYAARIGLVTEVTAEVGFSAESYSATWSYPPRVKVLVSKPIKPE